MRVARSAATVGVGATLALSLTACGGGSTPSAAHTPGPTSPPTSPASTPVASPSAPASSASAPASPSPSAATPSAAPAVARCPTSGLRGSLGGADGAAGTIYYQLTLTNTGVAPCQLGGYGGVSFVGAAGHQLGAAAQRDASQSGPRLLVLQPGGRAVARLGVQEAGNYDAGQCQPVTARGLRVYPPNETASLFIAHRLQACASPHVQLLTVQPYRSAG